MRQREGVLGHVGVGGSAPQRKAGGQGPGSLLGMAEAVGQQSGPLGRQLFERRHVELAGVEVEAVADAGGAADGHDGLAGMGGPGRQGSPEVRHVAAQGRGGAVGRVDAPQHLDEPTCRDVLPSLHDERGQQPHQPWAQPHRPPRQGHPERSQCGDVQLRHIRPFTTHASETHGTGPNQDTYC
nr:hypothetical protein [Catellatospora vulcania]